MAFSQEEYGASWEQFCEYFHYAFVATGKFCMRDFTNNMCIA